MIGLGIGVGWATKRRLVNYINELIKQFKDRVAADGGTFEAQSCLKTTLETLGIVVPPTFISAPVISGGNYAGSTVSTTNGVFDGVTPLTYTYQWLLDGSPILGSTNNTYTVTSNGDLTCKVTATNDFGSANSTSNSLVPEDRLIFSVKTDNAGTSASNQFTIPTSGTGYLYDIETSDGQVITGLTGDTTITFPSDGTYDIFINGSFPQFSFNNGVDRLKLLDIKNFGIYALGSTNQSNAFFGCSNMIITATDIGHFENVNSFLYTWANCSSLTSFPLIDTSSGTNFSFTWVGCSSLTSFPLINTSSGTNFNRTWRNCLNLVDFPSNSFDTNIASNYTDAFSNTSLSTQSIDNILVSLDTSGVTNGIFAQSGGGNTPSATGLTAKANLISKGWTVTTN